MRRLRLLPANLEGNEQFLIALRNQWTAYDDAQQREYNVTLIDYDNLANNAFHFSEEVWFEDRDRRRLDMVLFVNGLPVMLIENKSPKLQDPGLEGFEQVQETYTTTSPSSSSTPFPSPSAPRRLEYGATWNPSLNGLLPVEGGRPGLRAGGAGQAASSTGTQVLRLLRDYTIFYRMDDALAEVHAAPAPDARRGEDCGARGRRSGRRRLRPTPAWNGTRKAPARR